MQTCATSLHGVHGVQGLAAWGPGGAMFSRRREKCGLVGIPRSCQRSRSKQPHMQRGRQQRGQKPQQLFAFCQSWPCCRGSSPRCGALHQPRFPVPFPAQQLMPVPVPCFAEFCLREYKNHFFTFRFQRSSDHPSRKTIENLSWKCLVRRSRCSLSHSLLRLRSPPLSLAAGLPCGLHSDPLGSLQGHPAGA